MIDALTPPPLPPSIVPETVVLPGTGQTTQVVTVLDAARLAGVTLKTINQWILDGTVAICYTPDRQRRVFVDSLWRSFPDEWRR